MLRPLLDGSPHKQGGAHAWLGQDDGGDGNEEVGDCSFVVFGSVRAVPTAAAAFECCAFGSMSGG